MISSFKTIPSTKDLERSYNLFLLAGQKPITLDKLLESIQFCQFDPRLAELIVVHFSQHWKSYSPLMLREGLSKFYLNARLGVLLEFTSQIISKTDANLFYHWKKMVLDSAEKKSGEQFFIGVWQIGSSKMLEVAEFSTREYEIWGYLGRASLCPRSGVQNYSIPTRKRILESLLNTKREISVKEYWEAVGNGISLRQAERDLLKFKNVKSKGYTRSKRYTL